MRTRATIMAIAVLALSGGAAIAGSGVAGHNHGGHAAFAAGEPGDPGRPISRTVEIEMRENGDTMAFFPSRIEVPKGEQLRIVLVNRGTTDHEFMIDTPQNNARHAEAMSDDPEMRHEQANARRVAPGASVQMLWHFSRPGTFEFACLIPGHYEAGMHGAVVVR